VSGRDDGEVARVEYAAVYAAGINSVIAALVDKDFLAAYAQQIGATSWDITVDPAADSTRTQLRMTAPTHGIPALFRRFVPPTIEIVETRIWAAATDRDGRTGTVAVDAEIGRRDARVRGQVELTTQDGGTRFSMSGDVVVNLLVVGDRAAALVKDLIVRVLGDQTTVMNRWISSRDS
jgi:hypothetical protein